MPRTTQTLILIDGGKLVWEPAQKSSSLRNSCSTLCYTHCRFSRGHYQDSGSINEDNNARFVRAMPNSGLVPSPPARLRWCCSRSPRHDRSRPSSTTTTRRRRADAGSASIRGSRHPIARQDTDFPPHPRLHGVHLDTCPSCSARSRPRETSGPGERRPRRRATMNTTLRGHLHSPRRRQLRRGTMPEPRALAE